MNKEILRKVKEEKAITLVALVITIIVLLILAGITLSMVLGPNGIIERAKQAKEETNKAAVVSNMQLDILSKQLEKNGGNITQAELEEIVTKYAEEIIRDDEGNITGIKAEGVKGTISIAEIYSGELKENGPQVTLADGTKVALTLENVGEYLGKKVRNYKGQSSVTIGGKAYTVSAEYRLYYVDFDNKYGDGAGTIYLKAECTSNNYSLQTTDTSSDTNSNIKIKALNPSLYATGVTSPLASNDNMKAVTWLTNTTNWANLKPTDTTMASKVNYIVGSPSLEMMMDSYNTHYGLTGDIPDTRTLSASTDRVKLFYKYPYNSNNCGYGVGPSDKVSASSGYSSNTSEYSVKTDTAIDTMYYPGSNKSYWLASPSAGASYYVMYVRYKNGGSVEYATYANSYSDGSALCPLVSLQSGVKLILE